jgi:hypothetical protein
MNQIVPFMTPEQWMRSVFSAQAVNRGGVIRRSVRDVERLAGREVFVAEVRRRGFHAVENAGQIVVFCNNEAVRVVC